MGLGAGAGALSPLFADLFQARILVSRDQVRGGGSVEIERACVRWGAEYLGPLIDGEELLGLIAIAPKAGGGLADGARARVARPHVRHHHGGARLGAPVRAARAACTTSSRRRPKRARSRSAKALRDLRGAEQRLVQSEKLAALGQIVGGVAADLADEVRGVHARVAEVRGAHRDGGARRLRAPRRRRALARRRRSCATWRATSARCSTRSARAAAAPSPSRRTCRASPRPPTSDDAPRERAAARLEELVDSTLKLCAGHLRQVDAWCASTTQTLPPVAVETGPLGQVVLNLVLNATQAMRGVGTLTLVTRRCELDGRADGGAELAVRDTGPGIEPEILPRIFEPFFSTKGHTLGTGLGLSVSYGIVERHGGRIHVESALGAGTTFRVQLPLDEPIARWGSATAVYRWGEESPPHEGGSVGPLRSADPLESRTSMRFFAGAQLEVGAHRAPNRQRSPRCAVIFDSHDRFRREPAQRLPRFIRIAR